jgi:membrane protein implicated in regulation of membrane protease activity
MIRFSFSDLLCIIGIVALVVGLIAGNAALAVLGGALAAGAIIWTVRRMLARARQNRPESR